MPSIFTRSRTASTPTKTRSKAKNGAGSTSPPRITTDEFGRINSRASTVNTPASKADKKKDSKAGVRQRTHSTPQDPVEALALPDGSFLPFSGPPQDNPEEPRQQIQNYGHLSYQNEVVLGLEEVTRLVDVISNELSQRGLTTPLLFSNHALDISPSRIKRLIDAFLRTCTNYRPGGSADLAWREEAQFSGPHELAMILRWGLARIVRVFQGQETRGILSWESYLRWREDEGGASYPPHYFEAFLPPLPQQVQILLTMLLGFLARLSAHANSSGLTPPALSTLFGPLLFGLGSPALPFHHTYGAYLRCSHATEHLFLSFIRTQDATTPHALGTPSRLKDWIRGYPAMIPSMDRLDKARHGARTVCVTSVRRNVRLYSMDLVKTAASWAGKSERGDIADSKEWTRVMGPLNAKLVPRYSDAYRKRLALPPTASPDLGFTGSHSHSDSNLSSGNSLGDDELGLIGKEEENRFRSLTDLKWGEFESAGFGGADEQRLQFDLNEGARSIRNEKRTTLTWNDFSTTGFSRNDAPLSATLQFSTPLSTTISAWPTRQSEIQNKIKKTQKALPAFGWDTSPVLGGEEAVEEGFLDVFCDLLFGTGWIDRREQTFRECNWALVEYKSMPQHRPNGPAPADPRTGVSVWLYEEFIPVEYRSQLTAPKRKIPFSFSPSSKKQWKPAATLNGRPYVVGGVPRTPNQRELEFEGLLNGDNVTKVISLGTSKTDSRLLPSSASVSVGPDRSSLASTALLPPLPEVPASPAASATSTSRRSRFLPGGSIRRRAPAEYDALEFETRTRFANLSDDEVLSGDDKEKDPLRSKSSSGHGRGESKDDAWVDILVGSQRRMNEQAADIRPSAGRRIGLLRRSLSDPELAREEIAQALKDAGPVPPEDDDVLTQDTHANTPSPTDEDVYGAPEDDDDGRGDIDIRTLTRESTDSTDFEPMPSPPINLRSLADVGNPLATSLAQSRLESVSLPLSLQSNLPRQLPKPPAATVAAAAVTVAASVAPAAAAAASTLQPPPQKPSTPSTSQKAPGKGVSSLIEMYRERERESLQHSRLPVRSTSLNKSKVAEAGTEADEPELEPEPEPEQEIVLVRGEPLGDHLGSVAQRYVHGAPLHNVVEAPEEDDL